MSPKKEHNYSSGFVVKQTILCLFFKNVPNRSFVPTFLSWKAQTFFLAGLTRTYQSLNMDSETSPSTESGMLPPKTRIKKNLYSRNPKVPYWKRRSKISMPNPITKFRILIASPCLWICRSWWRARRRWPQRWWSRTRGSSSPTKYPWTHLC